MTMPASCRDLGLSQSGLVFIALRLMEEPIWEDSHGESCSLTYGSGKGHAGSHLP